ncbi:MAG: DNA-directed RNA polymerase [archaeon GW2011_AR20]|nr:MAG: DNA-directed RNA polymerase [archaeon GW2011_AR20]MBS3160153.1 DNA-directed RNA polymerase subunit B'' [Candidatus Woesearchaeota archaeon]
MNPNRILIKNYFENHSLVESNIESYNRFIEKGIQEIVNEIQDIIPTIIPAEVKDFKIKFGKIRVEKPQIVEADGSRRDIYPMEARLRKLTYSAPVYLTVSAYMDGVEREQFETLIGKVPVMVKSKFCHLSGLNKEQLTKHYEDPNDLGGYFILNGNERVLIIVEDLVSNKLFIERNATGPSKYTAKLYSESGVYRIPHTIEQMKDGIIYISFTRFKRVPIFAVIKVLGLVKDQDITRFISDEKQYDDVFINLYETVEIKSQEQAMEYLSKKIGLNQVDHGEKVIDLLDKYLLPHLGIVSGNRTDKAYNLCKYIKKFLMISRDNKQITDKDHYMNKRLKLSGDLLGDLFRINLRALVQDVLYNFQRLVKRGKFQSIKIIIRDQLLTSRIKSAMATGAWVGGRKGVSQNIDRTNFTATTSHLQRVVSLLSSAQENFDARALHPTHWGRLCPVETPEGTPIGLRKNLASLAKITQEEMSDDKVKKLLEGAGLNQNG